MMVKKEQTQQQAIVQITCTNCLHKIPTHKDVTSYTKIGDTLRITKQYTTQEQYDTYAISYINTQPVCTICFLEMQNWRAEARLSHALNRSRQIGHPEEYTRAKFRKLSRKQGDDDDD